MSQNNDQIYLDKLDEIGDTVYDIFNKADRKDLIMVYSMDENKIYSYIYADYLNSLPEQAQSQLSKQYQDAVSAEQIVLFIKDEKRQQIRGFNI